MRNSMKFKDTKLTKTIANRTLALLLSACMIGTSFGSVPLTAYATQGSDGLCDHHTAHDSSCGYSEAVQGHECNHIHDDSCGYSEGSACNHIHTEDCGKNGESCTHTHDNSCGYQAASPCSHTHNGDCGYSEATSGSPCTYTCDVCNGSASRTSGSAAEGNTGEGQDNNDPEADAECTCTEVCTEETFNTECPICKVGGANIDLCKGAKQESDEDEEEEKDDPAEEEKAAETKLLITAVAEPDSEITQQQLLVGASWEQIVFPDTLTVTVKELTAKTDTEGKSEAEGTESQLTLTGITWEIDPEESDGDTFDSSADSSGRCYVYVPVLPGKDAEGNELLLDEDAELPMIYVLIGEHGVMPAIEEARKNYVHQQEVSDTIDLSPYIKDLPNLTGDIISEKPKSLAVKYIQQPTISIDTDAKKCSISYTISAANTVSENSGPIEDRWGYRVCYGEDEQFLFALIIQVVKQMTPKPAAGQSVAPNGTLTYGENISKLTFQPVKFVNDSGKEVSGTLKWHAGATSRIWPANTQPDDTQITNASRLFTCTFSPDDLLYETKNYNVEVIIYPAKPTVAQAPVIPALERRETPYTAEDIIKLSEPAVQLTDINGTVIAADKITWTWKGSTDISETKNWSAGQHTETIVATYTGDTDNYQPVEIPVTITVTKAALQVSSVTASASYEHGAYLREQTLNGTVTDKYGVSLGSAFKIVWKNPNTQLSVSDNGTEYEYICIPYDAESYDRVEGTAVVTVNKPEYPPDRPAGFMNVSKSCDVVSKIALPTGWQWSERDKDKQLTENAVEVSVTAEYVGADKDNYANTTVTVSVKRSYCEHTKTTGVVVNTAPTCTTEGKGLIECAFGCGARVKDNITIPKVAHNYQRREPNTENGESELFEYYKCSVCGKEYMTAVQPPAPGGSSGGGSGNGSGTGSGNGSSGGTESSTAPTPLPTPATLLPTPAATQNPLLPELGSKPTAGKQLLNFLPKNDADDQNKAPFIKGENGKEGWEVIRTETEGTPEGSTVTVDMNGAVIVPSEVLSDIQGRDVTLVFDMGNGITWSVNGLGITGEVGDIDFGVAMGAQAGRSIPVEVLNNVTGERYAMNLTLAYEGEFGFTAVLTVNMKAENAGLYANLFYYNPSTGELEFICCDLIREDGATDLTFTHASDYTIVIDAVPMDGSVKAVEAAPEADAGDTDGSTDGAGEADGAGNMSGTATTHGEAAWNPLWIILIGVVVIVVGLGVFVIVKKKRDNGNE